MMNLGPMELVIVLVIALLVLGPKRLPDAGRSVGKGLREFKDAISGKDDEPAISPIAVSEPAPEQASTPTR
jgi:sec-independent protein translocase protein TatA